MESLFLDHQELDRDGRNRPVDTVTDDGYNDGDNDDDDDCNDDDDDDGNALDIYSDEFLGC